MTARLLETRSRVPGSGLTHSRVYSGNADSDIHSPYDPQYNWGRRDCCGRGYAITRLSLGLTAVSTSSGRRISSDMAVIGSRS